MTTSKYAVRRDTSSTLMFSALRRRHVIAVHDATALRLEDIELRCFGQPNLDPTIRDHLFTGPDDVRWFLNDVDITSALLQEMREKVLSLPAAELRRSYLEGVEYYLGLLSVLGVGIGVDVDATRKHARELVDQDLSKLFTKFCDRSVGWSGLLHPTFYVYQTIPIEPLSLTAVWHRHLKDSGSSAPRELRDVPVKHLQVCQRWTPSGGQEAPTNIALGWVSCSLSAAYENPLRKPLEEFAQRLKQIDIQLEGLRVSYLGPAQDALSEARIEAESGLKACQSAIDEAKGLIEKIRP
ncbi:MAG: hypothetical protein Q7K57_19580 [Burkholderiaceae bacterium]|nr:hypothetical protein [Burkholderiaceae bacterium]